jgi:hypothetical protein
MIIGDLQPAQTTGGGGWRGEGGGGGGETYRGEEGNRGMYFCRAGETKSMRRKRPNSSFSASE